MQPEISEFSYGFALTNEIVGWAPLKMAPIFPSLIEEGRSGGGYDVKLDFPAVPLYLQFKRAEFMKRQSAREIKHYHAQLSVPYYRFEIMQKAKSLQHDLLLELDSGNVFYAAPRFHQYAEINHAWMHNRVATRSIFISPREIGMLDEAPHAVAYDDSDAFLCSEPKKLTPVTGSEIVDKLSIFLKEDGRPLKDKLPELIRDAENAEERARHRYEEQYVLALVTELTGEAAKRLSSTTSIPISSPRSLTEPEILLRKLSDISARVFSSQIIFAQPRVA